MQDGVQDKTDEDTHQNFIACKLHVCRVDFDVSIHGGFQCRLVHHVLEVSASAASCAASHLVNINVRRNLHLAHVVLKNVMPAFQIWC